MLYCESYTWVKDFFDAWHCVFGHLILTNAHNEIVRSWTDPRTERWTLCMEHLGLAGARWIASYTGTPHVQGTPPRSMPEEHVQGLHQNVSQPHIPFSILFHIPPIVQLYFVKILESLVLSCYRLHHERDDRSGWFFRGWHYWWTGKPLSVSGGMWACVDGVPL